MVRPATPPALTPRQVEILRMAAQGLPHKAIERLLGLSHRSVANHISNARARMDRPSLVSAVWAARVQLEAG